MPKITQKGQVTIPKNIRNMFSMLPGTHVNIISEKNRVIIVRARQENRFIKWLGRGKLQDKKDVDLTIGQIRGRVDE